MYLYIMDKETSNQSTKLSQLMEMQSVKTTFKRSEIILI